MKSIGWVDLLKVHRNDTLRDALAKYLRYIKSKDPNYVEYGVNPVDFYQEKTKQKRKKSEEILSQITKGTRCSLICTRYPAMIA